MAIVTKSAQITLPALLLALTCGSQALAFNFKPFSRQSPNQTNTQAANTVHDKWAVLIGVSNFKDANIPPIKYGSESAGKLGRVFLDPYAGHFRNDHLVVLQQDDATKETIADVLTNGIASKALPNDLIVVYIASRWMPSRNGKELIFCASDTIAARPDETGLELNSILSTIRRRTQSRNILCLLDLSPVKGNSSTEKLFQNVSKTKVLQPGAIGKLSSLSNVSILSANDLTNSSAQTPFSETSYFVRFLIEDLKGSSGAATIATLDRMVSDQVRAAVKSEQKLDQMPEVCNVSDSLPNLTIGAVFAKPKNLAFIAGFPTNLKDVKFGYDAGRMPIDHPEMLPGSGIGVPVAISPRRNIAAQSNPPKSNDNQPDKMDQPQNIAQANIEEPEPGAKQIRLSQLKPATPNKALAFDKEDKDDDDDQPSKDLDLTPYISQAKKAIQAKWQPPKGLEDHKAVAVFTIMRDGTIKDPEIVEPTGIATVDRAALDALKAASPLPALPPGAPKTIQLKYKFEWKITEKTKNLT